MSARNQNFCLYGGVVFIVLFFAGWGLTAGFITPLPTPRDTPLQISQFFSGNTFAIRLGLLITLFGAPLQASFAALIAEHMRRIEGRIAPLASTQLVLGGIAVLLVSFPCFVWEAIAFRPLRDPQLMALLNDAAWLSFIGAFAPAMMQSLVIGIAVIGDRSERPVFPRWVAYFNFWAALLFIPGGIVFFAHRGPFAWNGIFPFWIPAAVFGAWFVVMFTALRGAIASSVAEFTPEPRPA
ncbi:MAG: hypothetical protein ACYDHH_30800 [Solirubrobacteraceae bacterium]